MLQNPFIPLNNRILEFNVFLIIKLKPTIFLKKRKKKMLKPTMSMQFSSALIEYFDYS